MGASPSNSRVETLSTRCLPSSALASLFAICVALPSCSSGVLTPDGGVDADSVPSEDADHEEDGDLARDADVDDDGDEDDDVPADAEVDGDGDADQLCTFAPRTAPLVLYYGTMHDEDGTLRDDLTFLLANPGLDVVFTIGGGSIFTRGEPTEPGDPGTGSFRDYHEQCLRMAYHMSISRMIACMAQRDDFLQAGDPVANVCEPYRTADSTGPEDLAAFWQAKIDLGWDYIAIDEIKLLTLTTTAGGSRGVDLRNDELDVRRFATTLDLMAEAGPDYDRRVIVFFAPHSADGPSAQLPEYRDLFSACNDHCRTVMHELYLTTREVESGRSVVFNNVGTALHNLGIPGINRTTTAIIAVGNDPTAGVPWEPFDHAVCDISPWDPVNPDYPDLECPALPGSGGIAEQLSAMHSGSYSRYWWGVGFYKIGAVRSESGHWNKEDFVRSTAERVDWWVHHDQP